MRIDLYDLVSRIEREQNNPELKKAVVETIVSTVRAILIDEIDYKINKALDRHSFPSNDRVKV